MAHDTVCEAADALDAAEKALSSFENIYWIAGGKPKTGGIAPLARFFPRVRARTALPPPPEPASQPAPLPPALAGPRTHTQQELRVLARLPAEAAVPAGVAVERVNLDDLFTELT